jgi:hypothetical protein
MSTQMLDNKQVEENSRILEELKASTTALKLSIEDFLSKDSTSEEEKEIIRTNFNGLFLKNMTKVRGVDIITNLSTGRVLLTKYNKEAKPRRWEIHADNNVKNESADPN